MPLHSTLKQIHSVNTSNHTLQNRVHNSFALVFVSLRTVYTLLIYHSYSFLPHLITYSSYFPHTSNSSSSFFFLNWFFHQPRCMNWSPGFLSTASVSFSIGFTLQCQLRKPSFLHFFLRFLPQFLDRLVTYIFLCVLTDNLSLVSVSPSWSNLINPVAIYEIPSVFLANHVCLIPNESSDMS